VKAISLTTGADVRGGGFGGAGVQRMRGSGQTFDYAGGPRDTVDQRALVLFIGLRVLLPRSGRQARWTKMQTVHAEN